MQKLLVMGLALIVAGLAWPFLLRLGLGHLPGDIAIRAGMVVSIFLLSPAF